MLKGRTLYIIWHTTDVIERAKERKIEISIPEAKQILRNMDKNYDATIGINWYTIDIETDDFISSS